MLLAQTGGVATKPLMNAIATTTDPALANILADVLDGYRYVHDAYNCLIGFSNPLVKGKAAAVNYAFLALQRLPLEQIRSRTGLYASKELPPGFAAIMEDRYRRFAEGWKGDDPLDRNWAPTKNQIRFYYEMERSDVHFHPAISFDEILNWPVLLEGHAKCFQSVYELILQEDEPTDVGGWEWTYWDSVYVRAIRTMTEILSRGKPNDFDVYAEFDVLAMFLALSDLAENPEIDTDTLLPIGRVEDWLPGHRFLRACEAAAHCGLSCSRASYMTFVEAICQETGWTPPWEQAAIWLKKWTVWPDFFPFFQFLACCKLRVREPLFFGLPCYAVDVSRRAPTWLGHLDELPLPKFRGTDNEVFGYISQYYNSIAANSQNNALKMNLFMEQLMLEVGPIDWSKIEEWKFDDKVLRRSLERHGVDWSQWESVINS